MDQNKILITGYQKASIGLFYKSLKYLLSNKKNNINYIEYTKFDEILIRKKLSNEKIKKNTSLNILKNFPLIITGTSETFLEKNIWNYCYLNNLNFLVYVESVDNLKIRFSELDQFPNNVLVTNNYIKKKIRNLFPFKSKNSNIINLGNINYYYLKRKVSVKQKINNNVLYVTSDIGIEKEQRNIDSLYEYTTEKGVNLYICVHPRENLEDWKLTQNKIISNNIVQGRLLEIARRSTEVFGIATMGLIDLHIINKKVFYFDEGKRSSYLNYLFNQYGVNSFKLRNNKIVKKIKKNKTIIPNKRDILNKLRKIIN